jgi:hypothetical protein
LSVASSTDAGEQRYTGLANAIDRWFRWWGTPASAARDVGALLLILAVCLAAVYVGVAHTRIFGHDVFLSYDLAWRVLNGQRPVLDYSPSMGPVLSLVLAAGLRLARYSADGIGYASALMGAITGVWGYLLARRRMAWVPATLAGLCLVVIAVAPCPLGFPPNDLSHAMVYNRYGYALLGLVLIEAFQPARGNQASGFWSGFSTGVATILMLFLKPTYAVAAGAFAGWSVVRIRPSQWRLAGMLAGAAVAGLAVMAYLRFDFMAVWNDFYQTAAARGAGISFWAIRWAIIKGLPEFLLPALLALFAMVLRSNSEPLSSAIKPLEEAILVLAGGALVLSTNAQPSGFPLNGLLALVLIEQSRGALLNFDSAGVRGFLRTETIVILLGLATVLPVLATNAASLGFGVLEARKRPPETEVARFHAPNLAHLLLYDFPGGTEADLRSNGRVYVNYVNDGMDLIRKVSSPQETVFTFDLISPFAYALLRPPAVGGNPNQAINFTFSDRHKPSPERLFGAADIIMVPKHPAASKFDADGISRNYLASVKEGYRICAESDIWQLYKRPDKLQACPTRP